MGVQITNLTNGGILFRAYGIVEGHEIISANAELYSSEEKIRCIKYQIVDLQGVADFRLTTDDMRALARQDTDAYLTNPKMHIVIVAPDYGVFRMNRVYQILYCGGEKNVNVVQTMDEANRWVEERMSR